MPLWHFDPFVGDVNSDNTIPWWELPDFGRPGWDIKVIWEPSRFDWVVAMAQRVVVGDTTELSRINKWLEEWCQENPAYKGANWKCGQEVSLRVLHLALAARLLDQHTCLQPDLIELIRAHLKRIIPTLSYAMAQDNNHGTSEAVALFVGGALAERGAVQGAGRSAVEGRKWLENRVLRLIAEDGSFSQYSLNYHRMVLDTLCLAELWRQWLQLPPFTSDLYDRVGKAVSWLYHLVNPATGDAPNLGENDGANLLPLTSADYRDYRPTVQLAMALFADRLAYPKPGPHDDHLAWLGVARPTRPAEPPRSCHYPDGGYSVILRGPWRAILKYPRYRFRPHHCDALHLDLWHGFDNVLRDGGTFSYNAEPKWREYFSGTASHNTVMFDGRDQMPSVGRFLRGAWLKAEQVQFSDEETECAVAGAAYTDWKGAHHRREVQVDEKQIRVEDEVGGFDRSAVMRWRLLPGDWALNDSAVSGEGFTIQVTADVEIVRVEIVAGWESRYYMQRKPLPVLEVEIRKPGRLTSVISHDSSL